MTRKKNPEPLSILLGIGLVGVIGTLVYFEMRDRRKQIKAS